MEEGFYLCAEKGSTSNSTESNQTDVIYGKDVDKLAQQLGVTLSHDLNVETGRGLDIYEYNN